MTNVQTISATTNKRAEEAKLKRAKLIEISKVAKSIKFLKIRQAVGNPENQQYWESKPLNYFIVNNIYKQDAEHLEFRTFHEWKKLGATIRKGEKAFAIWGQPKKGVVKINEQTIDSKQKAEGDPERMYDFFPICYLFSSDQVFMTTTEDDGLAEPEETQEHDNGADLDSIFAS